MSAIYETEYQNTFNHIDFVVKSLAEKPGRAIDLAINSGGPDGVQALFDAVMDKGHRMVLVNMLDAPSLPGWVREKLEVFLYGTTRQTAALFQAKTLH